MKEFFAQGEKERELGFSVSPLCNSEDIESIPKSQKGFINFLVKPLFTAWTNYLEADPEINTWPQLDETTSIFFTNMKKNVAMWEMWGDPTAGASKETGGGQNIDLERGGEGPSPRRKKSRCAPASEASPRAKRAQRRCCVPARCAPLLARPPAKRA
jgi:hypothetical protein